MKRFAIYYYLSYNWVPGRDYSRGYLRKNGAEFDARRKVQGFAQREDLGAL
jgi:hypothetical protein